MPDKREPPDLGAFLGLLNEHGVRYLVTGSAAAMLHGVALEPGDLDITPALDRANLERLTRVLEIVEARQDPDGPFGRWEAQADGEQRWIQREPTPEDRAARVTWQPDPDHPESFDHLLQTRCGALDVVPAVSGTYEDLVRRAVTIEAYGHAVPVESVADLLATLSVPRRAKDRDRVNELRAIQHRLGV